MKAEKLEPMIVRLPPEVALGLRELVRRTRIRQADLLRAAVEDFVKRARANLPEVLL